MRTAEISTEELHRVAILASRYRDANTAAQLLYDELCVRGTMSNARNSKRLSDEWVDTDWED